MARPVKPATILIGDFVQKADGTIFQVVGIAAGSTAALLSEVSVVPNPGAAAATRADGDTVVWGN